MRTKQTTLFALPVAAAMLAGHASALDITNGLVAHFPFNGSTAEAGDRFTVEVIGEPVYVEGEVCFALDFNGEFALIVHHLLHELTFDIDDEPYSIVCFVRLHGGASGVEVVVQDRFGANEPVSYGLAFVESTGKLISNTWYGQGTNDNLTTETDLAPFVDEWHHVAVTFDHVSREKTMYVDGVQVDQAERDLNLEFFPTGNTAVTIGAYLTGDGTSDEWFEGSIDDLRIYNRTLSPDDINQLVSMKSCDVDYTGDCVVNTLDVLAFLNLWTDESSAADFNHDGTVNTQDVLAFLNAWNAGCD